MNAPDFIRPETLLSILFQSPNATAVYAGEDITILSANGAMLKFWGKDRSVIGKNFFDAIPELADQQFLGLLQNVWRTGETYIAKDVAATLKVDGLLQEFFFDFEYKAILDESGKTAYILHTAFEVSERMAAWRTVDEKSRLEQELSENLMAINEEYQATNEELSAINEEYQVVNEELLRFQEQLQIANQSLQESEGRFRALVEHAPVAIAIYRGNKLLIEEANEQMLRIWGRDTSILGQPLLQARPELSNHPYIEVMQKVLKSGISHSGYAVKGPVGSDGEIVDGYFDVVYKPLLDANGLVSGIIVVASDVTVQSLARMREAEINEEIAAINEELTDANEALIASKEELQVLYDALNISESRFRMMIEHSPVAMASLKGQLLIVEEANEKVLQIWGKGKEVIGNPIVKALPELAGQAYLDILQEVFQSGKPFYGQGLKALLLHEGVPKEHYLNFVYQPVPGPDGQTQSILIVANDVTEQVQARQAADELNTRLEIALDASKLGATEVDIATGKMKSSDQFKKNYGFAPEEEFNYSDLFGAMFPEHHDRVRGLVREAMEINGVYQTEYPVRWRDGSIHWIQAHGRPRYNEQGKADRMVGMTLDITEAKLFEQRREDFLSIASHELKTPITSLKACIQLLNRLKDKPFTPMHTKLIEQATSSVEKMGKLVDELLGMKDMSQNHMQLDRSRFNLRELLSTCCNHVRLEGKYELVISGEEDVMVYADEHRVDQVLINFVNNAIKYAPESTQIFLSIERTGSLAKVSVKDTGPGIDSESLPHLFDRYYRIDRSGKAYNGLGLGLYICSEIIKKHGGDIGVESKPGMGSTFWFTLPC